MAAKNPHIKLSGMNNKTRIEDMPSNKARNAVNVQFANGVQSPYGLTPGEIIFSRPGKTRVYTGTKIHSVHNSNEVLFVENGSLKLLNDDFTATVLKSGIGDSRVFYTTVADTTYMANEVFSGKYKGGALTEWGTARPTRQPDCTAVGFGGMFAGDYRVAITWWADEQSGTGQGRRVTVAEGGGIYLTNFPTPPSYVKEVSVYVSSVNGDTMFLYGTYPANLDSLTLMKKVCTIGLDTQFAYPPNPTGKIILHQGRIYYASGNRVYRTEPQRYGLVRRNTFFQFDSEVTVICSAQPTLYVNTKKRLYQLTGLESPDGSPPLKTPILEGDATRGSECSDPTDPNDQNSFFMHAKGFAACSQGGVKLLNYDDVAIPFFEEGTSSVVEENGMKYLTFIGKNGTQNLLANTEYNTSELARGSL